VCLTILGQRSEQIIPAPSWVVYILLVILLILPENCSYSFQCCYTCSMDRQWSIRVLVHLYYAWIFEDAQSFIHLYHHYAYRVTICLVNLVTYLWDFQYLYWHHHDQVLIQASHTYCVINDYETSYQNLNRKCMVVRWQLLLQFTCLDLDHI
jgi:hypothetical protein